MRKEVAIPEEVVMSRIYEIRGKKVMIDRDLAELYGVGTKRLKEAVRRNKSRFPQDFLFEMTKDEFEDWRTQFAISKSDQKGLRYAPFCFTEQGVTMLACVLNSQRAIAVNIRVIRFERNDKKLEVILKHMSYSSLCFLMVRSDLSPMSNPKHTHTDEDDRVADQYIHRTLPTCG